MAESELDSGGRRVELKPGEKPRFNLAGFTGGGYERGAPIAAQVLWMALSRAVLMKWWMPNRLRIAALRAFGAEIGRGVIIRHDVKIHWPWKLAVGDYSWIGEQSWILNLERVTIGNNTCVSQDVFLCTGSHDRRSPTFEFDNREIVVGNGVWIAAKAAVLRGVHIGHNATIGASALVVKDVDNGGVIFAPLAQYGTTST